MAVFLANMRMRRGAFIMPCLFGVSVVLLAACLPATKKNGSGRAPGFAPTPGSGAQDESKNPGDPSQGGTTTRPSPSPDLAVTILPAPADQPVPADLPRVSLAFDMRGTLERDAGDAAVVRLVVLNGALSGSGVVRLSGKLTNLRNSQEFRTLDIKAPVDRRGVIDAAITGLVPETVYKITDLQVASDAGQGSERVKDPYFLVTSGPTRLAKARRKILLKALAEAYDWDHRNYDRSKDYGNSGGWCDRFYSWSASEMTSLKYPNYAPSYFQRNGGLASAADIKERGARESLAGDMVRYDAMFLGNHTFMIIAFDQATGGLWTVEGNFNNRVMRSQRQVEGAFKLGHLTEAMLR